MTFDDALDYMNGRVRLGWKLGLERFTELCHRLGDPQNRFRAIHITGTKGKGSTTAMSAAILTEAGYRTGAYFSPYVYDVRERVQIDGVPITRNEFAALVERIKPVVEELDETEHGDVTEFELKTALGFLYFAESRVDYACIEVGIGGRLDATNIISPEVCVITNIGLDHTQILGDTRAKIAFEKAGIIKTGVPILTASHSLEALEVIENVARERHAPLLRVLREDESPRNEDAVRWHLAPGDPHTAALRLTLPAHLRDGAQNLPFSQPLEIPVEMQGDYQRENAACAVTAVALALLQREDGSLARLPHTASLALSKLTLPGRFERRTHTNGATIVLDGAHNGMAAEALIAPLDALIKQRRAKGVRLVIGMLTGHEPQEVVAPLFRASETTPGRSRIVAAYVCAPQWKRALSAEELANVVRPFLPNATRIFPSVTEAFDAAKADLRPDEILLVTGSFYTVGEAGASEDELRLA